MKNSTNELVSYFDNINLLIIAVVLILFPVFFLSSTSDSYVEPKEILLIIGVSASVLLFGIKTIAEGRLRLRSSPFDLPILIFTVVLLASALFSQNIYDALTAFVPVLFLAILYYIITNLIRTEKQLLYVLASLVFGTVLASLLTILSFAKIYALPFSYTHIQYFTSFGALLDQAIYFAIVLPITAYFAFSLISSVGTNKSQPSPFAEKKQLRGAPSFSGPAALFSLAFIVIAIALTITVYFLLTSQKPLLLPFDIGLQTGFASISQDTGHVFKSFLVGSGFGTYLNDFTRFKQASFNSNENLWTYTFFRSSSFLLELIATTGILGLASYVFIIYKVVKEKNFFLPLILAIIGSIILPFSFTLMALFVIVLAVFAVIRIHNDPERFDEVEFYFVALKRGLLTVKAEGEHVALNPTEKRYSKLLPLLFLIIMVVVIGVPLYFSIRYILSDMVFQQSLLAAQANEGQQTYDLETNAISLFPYRDIYYRAFSQTNLALANALAVSQKSGQPSQQVQQNILTLIQQAITTARTAATVAPLTSFNWNNLSSVYRSLIGFGQNAQQFTILTEQQAIALDPNNPQQYIDFGGIYYQIGDYNDAAKEFQIAINLKPDYANAYYNLGHAYEASGALQSALIQFQTVRQLVANNPTNVKQISDEIVALNQRIGQQAAGSHSTSQAAGQTGQQALNVNKPANTLPSISPEAKIPAPTVEVTPIPSPTGQQAAPITQSPSPTVAQ